MFFWDGRPVHRLMCRIMHRGLLGQFQATGTQPFLQDAILESMHSEKLTQAFDLASALHKGQFRKGTGEPYLSHVMGVAALVIRYGGTAEEASGALLHDAAEDCGGEKALAIIRKKLGPEVEMIVRGCSDTTKQEKPPWKERKKAFINSLPSAPPSVILVSNCDKIYNLGTILDDYRAEGEDLWKRFQGKKKGTLWYYRTLADFYSRNHPSPAARKLNQIKEDLEAELASR